MTAISPNDMLVRRVRALPRVTVQNALMRLTDRQIALSLRYMEESDRIFLYRLLPETKVRRIREELRLQERVRITYGQYRKTINAVIDALAGGTSGGPRQSYLRPIR